jgi:hypothetical protein
LAADLFVPTLALVSAASRRGDEPARDPPTAPSEPSPAAVRQRPLAVRAHPGVAAIAGVEGGVQIAEQLPQDTLRRLFGALMLIVAAQVAFRALRKPAYSSES